MTDETVELQAKLEQARKKRAEQAMAEIEQVLEKYGMAIDVQLVIGPGDQISKNVVLVAKDGA